jgi:hypothetical protein
MRATFLSSLFRVLTALTLILALSPLSGCSRDKGEDKKDESLVKSGVAAVVSGAVATSKEVLSGTKQGIEEGRKTGESSDGAIVVSKKEDFLANASASVGKVEELGDGVYQISLNFKNDQEKPVRLTNIFQDMILLDVEGFAYKSPKHPGQSSDVTVLARTSERARVIFEGVELEPKTLRFYQIDFELPGPVTPDSASPKVSSDSK